ncbi:SDR family NAD(P)-dependent oxidoreductase [Goodfellowiella coeruleoviolacea]|uniref:NAD(P)-dependent dehydrogenase, short-chain alcohol dehydrogenase family n=1 Tax=Goodfellowiella coeruleoviolacea TaxID=334858 RepID=A0AAE3KJX0_9PSEU|nr:SDR family oxidoreductase [Goodfellowiella coeruleoviolacea]MCP2164798.1 NAD(P)-dependent dehydrogenase, short-chain alcohol dehydrogenase family [Goodfellowiella coeruleoviolacea]
MSADVNPTTSDLTDRAVIVTGAGSGIGRATALAFALAGARVLGVGRRPDALAATAEQHPAIAAFPADLRAEDSAEAVIAAAVRRWGRVDVVVNNAGVTLPLPLAEVTAAQIADLMAVNVTAPSLLARAALPWLTDTRGAIVNVSSTFGHRPAAGVAHYAASKAALEQLTRSWALELAPHRIRVNAVAPGPTESEALAAAGLSPAEVDQVKRAEAARIPLGRRGEPAEVATWIVRLADPRATWLTGQVLTVDGGFELA